MLRKQLLLTESVLRFGSRDGSSPRPLGRAPSFIETAIRCVGNKMNFDSVAPCGWDCCGAMSLPLSTFHHGSSVGSTVNSSVLPPDPVLAAAVSLKVAAACLDRYDVLAAVASLRAIADRLEMRFGPPAPKRKRPLAGRELATN